MLPGAGLRDDALLPHPKSEQTLAKRVVDLVRTCVIKILAFDDNVQPRLFAESPALRNRSGSANIFGQQAIELGAKISIRPCDVELPFELVKRRDEGLWNEAAAKSAKSSLTVRSGGHLPLLYAHQRIFLGSTTGAGIAFSTQCLTPNAAATPSPSITKPISHGVPVSWCCASIVCSAV